MHRHAPRRLRADQALVTGYLRHLRAASRTRSVVAAPAAPRPRPAARASKRPARLA